MTAFNAPIDIFARACQHLGVRRVLQWGENTVQFNELFAAYPKIRQAELERNVWTCAVRRAVLEPLTTTARLFIPPTWQSSVTYPPGAVVVFTDTLGTNAPEMWVSTVPLNQNNAPSVQGVPSGFWTPYFGPLSVDQWQNVTGNLPGIGGTSTVGSSGYNVGELVYIAPGDGNAFIYSSKTSANQDDPWQVDTWQDSQIYSTGQIVGVWILVGQTLEFAGAFSSAVDLNYGNQPNIVAGAIPWASLTPYASGVYVLGSDNMVYQSLVSANQGNNPVTDNGTNWTNQIADQYGVLRTMWGGTWVSVGSPAEASSPNWLYQAGGTVAPIFFNFPLSSGPLENTSTLNAFLLPQGFLREARENPKQGVWPFLGAPNRQWPDDWVFDGPFIVSAMGWPITLRFIADITDVGTMDPMLCEGIAASLAKAVWNRIPDKSGELQLIWKVYQAAINDARTRNAIEQGPTEPYESKYITARL